MQHQIHDLLVLLQQFRGLYSTDDGAQEHGLDGASDATCLAWSRLDRMLGENGVDLGSETDDQVDRIRNLRGHADELAGLFVDLAVDRVPIADRITYCLAGGGDWSVLRRVAECDLVVNVREIADLDEDMPQRWLDEVERHRILQFVGALRQIGERIERQNHFGEWVLGCTLMAMHADVRGDVDGRFEGKGFPSYAEACDYLTSTGAGVGDGGAVVAIPRARRGAVNGFFLVDYETMTGVPSCED